MKKKSHIWKIIVLIVAILFLFVLIGCERMLAPEISLDENGQLTIEESEVEITFFVYDNEIEIINKNQPTAHVIVHKRVYGGAEKWNKIFDKRVSGAEHENWVRDRAYLDIGDLIWIEIYVGDNYESVPAFEIGG